MGRDEAFHIATAVGIGLSRFARQHEFEDVQHVPCDLDVCNVAGVMEGDEQFVLEPTSISANWNSGLRSSQTFCSADVVFSWRTRHETS